MKKFLISLAALFVFSPIAFAGECTRIDDVEDYWVRVKSGVNIRDQVCDGNVIGSLTTGTLVKVTGEIEGWRYIETPDGGVGFIWSDFVEVTSPPGDSSANGSVDSAGPVIKDALYDIVGNKYEEAIRYLADKNIIQGYPDGSYKPENSVNRAEFTKIIVGAKLGDEPKASAANCFPDVKSSDWFASYVCYAKTNGIIAGYPDGTFKPGSTINLAEASKILVNTLDVPKNEDESGEWYEVYIRSLQYLSYIPSSFNGLTQNVNRSQMAEMVWRILEKITNLPAKTFTFEEVEVAGVLSCPDSEIPSNIDIDQVRSTWFSWVNEARNAAGRNSYSSSRTLDATAQTWADYSADVGVMSHSRPGQTAYYDYKLITQWFADLGVTFKNKGGWTYSENIGRSYMTCDKSDCTQELIEGTRLIFDAYMKEKGTSYTAHYDSVMSPNFTVMGIAWTIKGTDVYVTVHYAAEIDKAPSLICS